MTDNHFEQQAHGYIYKIGESEIFVRNRPYSLETDARKWKDEDEADAYMSVTDSFVVPPVGKPFAWMPWNEGRVPTPELYYGCLRVLNWWIFYQKVKRIQLFCDGGTHRSVTIFGAYLRAYHTLHEADEIVENRVEVFPFAGESSTPEMRKGWAQPLEYIERYLHDCPEDRLLLTAMGKDRLGRLEGHSRAIWEGVVERYGDNQGKK